ncbi:hypothetical protein E8E11_000967 [Didymella keratinophila]|nr:hypothetical protein E8E11_000967 [Didymella keratinophila]
MAYSELVLVFDDYRYTDKPFNASEPRRKKFTLYGNGSALGKTYTMAELMSPLDWLSQSAQFMLSPIDFRHAVDELRHVPFDLEEKQNAINKVTRRDILSVRGNCDVDCRFLRRSTLDYIYKPASAANVVSETATPVADAIGLPLVDPRMPPALIWRERNRRNLQHMETTTARLFNPPD